MISINACHPAPQYTRKTHFHWIHSGVYKKSQDALDTEKNIPLTYFFKCHNTTQLVGPLRVSTRVHRVHSQGRLMPCWEEPRLAVSEAACPKRSFQCTARPCPKCPHQIVRHYWAQNSPGNPVQPQPGLCYLQTHDVKRAHTKDSQVHSSIGTATHIPVCQCQGSPVVRSVVVIMGWWRDVFPKISAQNKLCRAEIISANRVAKQWMNE